MDQLFGIALRGIITYLYVLALVRLSGKRTIRALMPMDLVVGVIIGDIFDNMFYGQTPLWAGMVGMTTVILAHLLVTYTAYLSPSIERWVSGRNVQVIQQGALKTAALHKERLRPELIMSLVRLQGEEQLDAIEEGYLEPNGRLSLRLREAAKPAQQCDRPALERLLQ